MKSRDSTLGAAFQAPGQLLTECHGLPLVSKDFCLSCLQAGAGSRDWSLAGSQGSAMSPRRETSASQ